MILKREFLTIIPAILGSTVFAATHAISLDFKADTVIGGDLVISGTGDTGSFKGSLFDEQASSIFEIQNITDIGSIQITASSLDSYLNVTSDGLQDGTSGYNASGEGTSFTFDTAVRIQSLDWGSFTYDDPSNFDQVSLYNGIGGSNLLGTFVYGQTIGSTSFADTNPATMDILVEANHSFRIQFEQQSTSNGFYLESMSFNIVPEPSAYALALGICSLLSAVIIRKRLK